jgi:hypothetical protein
LVQPYRFGFAYLNAMEKLTKEHRDILAARCKEHVEEFESTNMKDIADNLVERSIIPEPKSDDYIKVSFLIKADNRYETEKRDGDGHYMVFKNPNYELSEITKKTSQLQQKILRITVTVAILTLIVQAINVGITLSNQAKQKDLQKQLDNLKPPAIHIDSVVVHRLPKDS